MNTLNFDFFFISILNFFILKVLLEEKIKEAADEAEKPSQAQILSSTNPGTQYGNSDG